MHEDQSSFHDLLSPVSLTSNTAPQPGVLFALFAVSTAVLPADMGPPEPQSRNGTGSYLH